MAADAELEIDLSPDRDRRRGAAGEDTDNGGADSVVGTVRRQASKGFRWTLAGQMASKIGSLAMNLVLARLLLPADFGVYAIALSAVTFLMMVDDIGIIAAATQWQGEFKSIVPTASIIALASSTLFFGIAFVGAPAFAALAGSQSATPLLRLVTTAILIDGVIAVRTASLLRTFKQNCLVVAHLCGVVAQLGVGISLAVAGRGPLSLAAAYVASYLVMGVCILWFAKLPFTFSFDRAIAKRLLRFGLPLAASLGAEAVLLNTDYVIVGRALGATAVGLYLLAFNVSSWAPGVILNALRWVAMPSFSQLSEDKDAFSYGVQRSVVLLVTFMLPVTVVITVLAPTLVVFLYGDVWAPAAGVLQFLAVLGVVRLVTSLTADVLSGAGKTFAALWVHIGWAVALIPALIIGTHLGGIRGTGIAHVAVGAGIAVPLAMVALRRVGVPLLPIARALLRPLLAGALAALVCAGVAWALDASAFMQLAVAGTAAPITYVLTAFPLDQVRRWADRAGALVASRAHLHRV
jgi:PST family polysaccharide transporter